MPATSPFAIPNIRLFIAFRILFNCRFYYPIFTILFLDYGLTIEQFALLNTVWAITIFCAEVPSGALADVLGRKQLLVATALLMVVEMGIIAFVPVVNITLVFWAFLINRVMSGLAEAMASGADEAIAFDSLSEEGLACCWPKVLSLQMRLKSIGSIITGILGALIYDPNMMNRLLNLIGSGITVNQQQTMRYPVYLTLILALLATFTAFLFQESDDQQQQRIKGQGFIRNMKAAMAVTLQAGNWIMQTPFALAVILFGMFYDHILRMLITLTSQYYRLIELPEASFGVLGAAMSLFGLYIPKLCEQMVDRYSPRQNMFLLLAITLAAIFIMRGFYPYIGLVAIAFVYVGLTMVSFFTSHYLNQITTSSQRATVLSFKGMAFNLGYGLIGILFALLMQQMRGVTAGAHPNWSSSIIEEQSFMLSIGWFPWYTLLLFVGMLLLNHQRLQGKPVSAKE
ncbi:MFS transporter [Desulfopila aestuarii]|uniref:Nitrate/nitrite transporter NarK n=1 Tax=Desulfopila aestuarii DSM 18488 TaxID=1121416 RepID=A0A1M7Y731_9BACT|nr:MFS transporter [Desulfopila aestuarii]SHO48414.1 Nitrate/nitrite transporter NarK [Desulfopila aestuarii DSM 18488]